MASALLCVATTACQVQSGPEREISGQLLYERHCSRCHGVGGVPPDEGAVPSLADPVRIGQLSDDQIDGIIRQGRPPRMPGFGEQFLEPSRKVLIAYIRSLSAERTAGGSAKEAPP